MDQTQTDQQKVVALEKDIIPIKNTIATLMYFLAWGILVLGGFFGMTILEESPFMAVVYWIGAGSTSLFMFGFSEIINLLHGIYEKVKG